MMDAIALMSIEPTEQYVAHYLLKVINAVLTLIQTIPDEI